MQVLLADMGGTNIRFALWDKKKLSEIARFRCADFSSFECVLAHFLSTQKAKPKHFVLAVPAPVLGDELSFVNNSWRFKISKIKRQFGFKSVDVMNDFQAQALSVTALDKKQIVPLSNVRKNASFPSVVVGAGTGLGVGILLPGGTALSSEGGHIGVSPINKTEEKILHKVLLRFRRVSAERVISGPGLGFLYEYFTRKKLSGADVLDMALAGDKKALKALFQMFAFWGSVCGDLALTLNALGGIYLSGGIVQADGVVDLLQKSDFMQRFCAKGRHGKLMAQIPCFAIIQKDVAFVGLCTFAETYFV